MMSIKNYNINTAKQIMILSNDSFIYRQVSHNESLKKKNNRHKKFDDNINQLISINIIECKIANNSMIVENEPFVSIKYYTKDNESCNLCIPLYKCKHLINI